MTRMALSLALIAACGGHKPSPTTAGTQAGGCSPAITASVTSAFPDAKQDDCHAEHEDGMDIVEVRITKADGSKAEIELTSDGTIQEVEEVVATAALPEPVAKAFAAKYPGATATKVERVTAPGKPASFEIAFAGKEATFSETGDFIEEEGADTEADTGSDD